MAGGLLKVVKPRIQPVDIQAAVGWGIATGAGAIWVVQENLKRFPKKMNVFLKDIVPAAQNNINTRFIILDKARSPTTVAANGNTCMALAADETAAVHIQLWGDECEAFEAGDIVKLTNGIFSYVRNSGLVLRAGKRGKMEKIGEFTVAFVETPNVSEIQWKPDPENPKRYIQNAVDSAYSRIFPPLL